MALLRLNVPGLILYGGSILPGQLQGPATSPSRTSSRPWARTPPARSATRTCRARGRRLPRRRRVRRAVHRQHHGDGDRVHRPVADGHGQRRRHRRAQSTKSAARRRATRHGRPAARPPPARDPHARRVRERHRRRRRHRRLHQRGAAPAGDGARGRRAAHHRRLRPDQPAHAAAGRSASRAATSSPPTWTTPAASPSSRKRLVDGGCADGCAITVTGRTIAEEAAQARETARPGSGARRSTSRSSRRGGLVILQGQPRARRLRDQGRRPRAQATIAARRASSTARKTPWPPSPSGQIKPGDVVVIRYEGPRGGPGMREMLGVTAAIVGEGLGETRRARDRRPLQRRHARAHGRPRRARGRRRRPDRRVEKATRSSSTSTRAASTSTSTTRRWQRARRSGGRRRRATRTACSPSTRRWCRRRPRAPSRGRAEGGVAAAQGPSEAGSTHIESGRCTHQVGVYPRLGISRAHRPTGLPSGSSTMA